jgi:hypothetical protein
MAGKMTKTRATKRTINRNANTEERLGERLKPSWKAAGGDGDFKTGAREGNPKTGTIYSPKNHHREGGYCSSKRNREDGYKAGDCPCRVPALPAEVLIHMRSSVDIVIVIPCQL